MESKDFKYSVSSVEKMFDIIRIMSRDSFEHGASEIAAQIGENRNTVHRFLRTLESLGYAEQNPVSRKYYLSYKFLGLSYDICNNDPITNKLLPYIRMFSLRYNVTCCLYYYHGTSTYLVHSFYAVEAQSAANITGTRLPSHASAPGRLLLSTLPEDELDRYLNRKPLIPYTNKTIVSREALIEELQRIRDRGYVILDSELVDGSYSIGFPIFNKAGKLVASIALITKKEKSDRISAPEVIEDVMNTLSRAL